MPTKGSFLNGGGLWTGGGGFYPRGGLVVGWTWRREPGRGTVSTGVSLVQTPHLDRFALSVLELENSVVFLESICNQVRKLLTPCAFCCFLALWRKKKLATNDLTRIDRAIWKLDLTAQNH